MPPPKKRHRLNSPMAANESVIFATRDPNQTVEIPKMAFSNDSSLMREFFPLTGRGTLTNRKPSHISEVHDENMSETSKADADETASASQAVRQKLRREVSSKENSLTRRAAAMVFNVVFLIFETFFLKPASPKSSPDVMS
mmetsp:Transcript_29374/g.44356  ORF Transcript_29374/g.44356 Transcript_29374/m.44356 type:complete len:141 (+) Transcript_29374:365-787(+)